MNKDDGGRWSKSIRVSRDLPDNYKEHAYQELTWEFGKELWGILQQVRQPCVVTTKERQWVDFDYHGYATDVIAVDVDVKAVERKDITMVNYQTVPILLHPKISLVQRLQRAYTYIVHNK
jgi:hypothetical protein